MKARGGLSKDCMLCDAMTGNSIFVSICVAMLRACVAMLICLARPGAYSIS